MNIETTSANVSSTTVLVTTVTETTNSETIWTTTTTETTQTVTAGAVTTIDVVNTITIENVSTTQVIQTEELSVPQEAKFLVNPETYSYSEVASMHKFSYNGGIENYKTFSISTTEELIALANYVNDGNTATGMTFVLGADIDLSSISNWTPIGSISVAFKGTFDGNGHVIKNMTINDTSAENLGLFGVINGGTVKNVAIDGGSVNGYRLLGLLAGGAEYANISNCYVIGDVDGTSYIGGLVGGTLGTTISNCYATADVTANSYVIGGLVGQMDYGTISNCYSTGDVQASSITGKLIGQVSGVDVTNCYSTGTVTGSAGGSSVDNSSDWDGTFFTYNSYTIDRLSTESTTMADLGLNPYTTLSIKDTDGNSLVSITNANTIRDIIDLFNANTGYQASFYRGVLSISSTDVCSIDMNSDFFSFITAEGVSTSYNTTTTTQTETVQQEQTIPTNHTETIYITTTSSTTHTTTLYVTTTTSNTQTNTVWVTSTVAATGGTTFEELGVSSAFKVTVVSDGTKSTLTVNKDTTFDEFFAQLQSKGFGVSETLDEVSFTGAGDTYLSSTYLNNLLSMGALNKTEATKTVNTDSEHLTYDEILEGIYAPGTINLQVGTSATPESLIQVDVSFKLADLRSVRGIGIDGNDYLEKIDDILELISERQVHFGAVQNRLESVLEEIAIRYDNLASSRSTIRDADIADESASYIQAQILQQAAATLMSTANQSPAIALQLI